MFSVSRERRCFCEKDAVGRKSTRMNGSFVALAVCTIYDIHVISIVSFAYNRSGRTQ